MGKNLWAAVHHRTMQLQFGHYENWFESLALEAYTLLRAILP